MIINHFFVQVVKFSSLFSLCVHLSQNQSALQKSVEHLYIAKLWNNLECHLFSYWVELKERCVESSSLASEAKIKGWLWLAWELRIGFLGWLMVVLCELKSIILPVIERTDCMRDWKSGGSYLGAGSPLVAQVCLSLCCHNGGQGTHYCWELILRREAE